MSFCSKCGTNNAEESLFCTECGAVIKDNSLGRTEPKVLPGMESKPTPKKKVAGIIACVLVWLFLVANVFGASSNNRTVYEIKAEQLGKEYLNNAKLADAKYKGARVKLNGVVAKKGQYGESNDLFVELYHLPDRDGKWVEVLIDVPIREKTKVNNLKVGDFIEVDGECLGHIPQSDKTIISVQIFTTNFSN